jgi:hypothetical protein
MMGTVRDPRFQRAPIFDGYCRELGQLKCADSEQAAVKNKKALGVGMRFRKASSFLRTVAVCFLVLAKDSS